MKKLLILLFVFQNTVLIFPQTVKNEYDSILAKKLGADQYGMKSYIFAILKTGDKTISDKAVKDSIFDGHLRNIHRLADEGLLVIAGPFIERNTNGYRGIFILNVKTEEEAEKLLQTDPAVKADLLKPEIYKWYGSAALPEYLKVHPKIKKSDFVK